MRRPPLLVVILFAMGTALLFISLSMPTTATAGKAEASAGIVLFPPSAPTTVANSSQVILHSASSLNPSYWLPSTAGTSSSSLARTSTVAGCGPMPGPAGQQTELRRIPPASQATCDDFQGDDMVACVLASAATDRAVLLLSSNGASVGLQQRLTAARDAVARGQLVLVSTNAEAAAVAQSLNVAWYRPGGHLRPAGTAIDTAAAVAMQWRAASRFLRLGCTVVVSTSRVTWRNSPFPHLARDVDVEAAQLQSGGSSASRGSVVGVHDPPMGWSAYGQTMTCPLLDPAVVGLQPTAAAAELADQLAARIENGGSRSLLGSGRSGLAGLLTMLVHQPAHDGDSRSGVTMRVLRSRCFTSAPSVWPRMQGAVSSASPADSVAAEEDVVGGSASVAAYGPGSNAILSSADSREALSLIHI